ncbi:MAG: hypothetical protein JNN01_21405 [Opitutaceae bacterium]|nr:hypothetical protein [Opitutaceae bacterium]
MAVTFKSTALLDRYLGNTNNLVTELSTFRTGGDDELDDAIAKLDERIAAFENILIGALPAGQTTTDYPYDREGLKREFLDEVLALLLRRSITYSGTVPSFNATYSASDVLISSVSPYFPSDFQVYLNRNKPNSTGFGVFDTMVGTTDTRPQLLNSFGQTIFSLYSTLIDEVFAEGDKLGNNPARPVQVASAIQPITVDGFTYDRISQVHGTNALTGDPEVQTYLLDSQATNSRVIKASTGDAGLSGPATSSTVRLQLVPEEATDAIVSGVFLAGVDVGNVAVRFPLPLGSPPTIAQGLLGGQITTVEIPAVVMNIKGRESEFPEARIVSGYRGTLPDGRSFLVGVGTDSKIYVTSLESTRRSTNGTTAGLSVLEYLLYWNEARIKILRAKLAYQEAVVREIQDDLKQANDVLAKLETQSGKIQATDKDGVPTGQTSSETLEMNMFSAMASTSGNSIFDTTGQDALHTATEWQGNRTNLKNYIDRRSAEAQQATLDYQNVLNRFNNAFEVMAKLQEKFDTLLKAQLRNL